MGRVSRRRRSKKKLSSLRSESEDETPSRLEAWMRSEKWSPTCDLICYDFEDTGRGLKALEDVKPNELIVKIPKSLLITTSVASHGHIKHLLVNPQVSDAQSVLAAFLIYELHLGVESEWKPYLDTIPNSFSNPYFCRNNEKKQLPSYLSDVLSVQSAQIKSTFLALMISIRNPLEFEDDGSSIELKRCRHCGTPYEEIITFSKYQWAYFVVNTRAVYIDDREGETRFRNDNLALAPYLDLINHSFDASVRTGLFQDQTKTEYYQITTLKAFDKGSQVFINYGSHDNTKLYVEYGFFIPNNPLDEIYFDISDIDRCVTLSEVQCNFIVDHGLDKKMGFNSGGLNYYGKMTLFIAVTKFKRKEDWLMKIYGNDLDDREISEVFSLGTKILELKKTELFNQSQIMKQIKGSSDSFKIALDLVEEHLRVLERSVAIFHRHSSV